MSSKTQLGNSWYKLREIRQQQTSSPTQLNFQEEYAIVARMLETLEAFASEVAATVTVSAWIPALRTRYDAFMTMLKSYDAERAAVVPGAVKQRKSARKTAKEVTEESPVNFEE